MTFNKITTELALMQDIEVGSYDWNQGGMHAFAGQTGGHPAYGWRRPEVMDDYRVSCVIANYAARPVYYDATQHPVIESGYRIAGRPKGWEPEDVLDLPSGERAYLTEDGIVAVSGLDPMHFWLTPLHDVMDRANDITVETPFGVVPADDVAKMIVQFHIDSLAGMIRNHGQYWGGGRLFARVVDTFVESYKRGCVDAPAGVEFIEWLETFGLPALEDSPGVTNAKGVGVFQPYQDISWVLPACYDLAQMLKTAEENAPTMANTVQLASIRQRAEKVVTRLSQWALDIDQIAGGAGGWEKVSITPKMVQGNDGKTLDTLIGAIEKSDVGGEHWYSAWAVRAADIAARTLPGDQSEDYFHRVLEDGTKAKDQQAWFVDANRDWLVLPT